MAGQNCGQLGHFEVKQKNTFFGGRGGVMPGEGLSEHVLNISTSIAHKPCSGHKGFSLDKIFRC